MDVKKVAITSGVVLFVLFVAHNFAPATIKTQLGLA